MGSATYDTISEDELIKKYNSFIVPCEESKSILFFLWKKHLPFITNQCRLYFSNSSYINFEDILQDCFFTFMNVLRTYNPALGSLNTVLLLPLRHDFTDYMANAQGYSRHINLMVAHVKTVLVENDLTGNEDIHFLTDLYNQKYTKNPIKAKTLKKYLEYYMMQDIVRLDQGPIDNLKLASPTSPDPVWQDIDTMNSYTIVRDYIKTTEGNDRLLLLFLFGFTHSVDIAGKHYTMEKFFLPLAKDFRKPYQKLFPPLIEYLYDNAVIADKSQASLINFIRAFTIPENNCELPQRADI